MFRFHKPVDVVTLFHKASSPASVRVANILKQVSANASASATEDQASDHSAQTATSRPEFDLDITEDPPTPDQLQIILEYVGASGVPSIIKGATSQTEALKKFKENRDSFQWPVVVDWHNGKACSGSNESQILKMLSGIQKK